MKEQKWSPDPRATHMSMRELCCRISDGYYTASKHARSSARDALNSDPLANIKNPGAIPEAMDVLRSIFGDLEGALMSFDAEEQTHGEGGVMRECADAARAALRKLEESQS